MECFILFNSSLKSNTMTTEQLRKEITVYSYGIYDKGIYIGYTRKGDTKHLTLDPEECARQLSAIGSIESWTKDENGLQLRWEEFIDRTVTWGWNVFHLTFKLSQWEALTLAIRYESEKELQNDANLLEMDKIIEALKNS